MNAKAKQHYDNAVTLLTAASTTKNCLELRDLAYLASVSIRLAEFAAAHPLVVEGISDIPPPHPQRNQIAGLWGGPMRND